MAPYHYRMPVLLGSDIKEWLKGLLGKDALRPAGESALRAGGQTGEPDRRRRRSDHRSTQGGSLGLFRQPLRVGLHVDHRHSAAELEL